MNITLTRNPFGLLDHFDSVINNISTFSSWKNSGKDSVKCSFLVPGLDKSSLKAEIIEDNKLRLYGTKEDSGETYQYDAVYYVPKGYNPNSCKIKVENGVAAVSFQKSVKNTKGVDVE